MNKKIQKLRKSVSLDETHWRLIKDLIPFYGSSEPEIVRNIVLMWLDEHLGSNTIKELKEIGMIKFETYDDKWKKE